jgi:cbb3-type cytochrome oxidase cytochrome c subunit
MQISKRDVIFVVTIIVVLGALFVATTKESAKSVPLNEKHKQFYEVMKKRGDRKEVEKGCTACHGNQTLPLPKSHPPKEQCLICHKLLQSGT